MRILRADNQQVDAKIVELTAEMARDQIDAMWWTVPDVPSLSSAVRREGDNHWIWEDFVRYYNGHLLHECVAVLSQEGYVEGAMVYQFNADSKLESGEGSVYIEFLASAPRNRSWLVSQPQYKGIGSTLTYWAMRESYSVGLGGRVSLQSLPSPMTLGFYESKGFIRTDMTQPMTGLIDYELPKSAALTWLKKEGDL